METTIEKETTSPEPEVAPVGDSLDRLVRLLQCGKSSCGHVLLESEQVWVPHPDFKNATTGTCPKCGNEDFFNLNALGQKRKMSDRSPRDIDPKDIDPSPRMGLKMKRRLLAAKRRALEANDPGSPTGAETRLNKCKR